MQLTQLRHTRPPEPEILGWRSAQLDFSQQEYHRKVKERHWSHMMTERQIEQEMFRRCGPDYTDQYLDKAQKAFNLLT